MRLALIFTTVLSLAAARAWADDAPQTLPGLAVLPVRLNVDDVRAADASALMTSMLTTRIAQEKQHRVISANEIAELLRNETERQGIGASDDGVLKEAAGALGAQLVAVSEVHPDGDALRWEVSLVDQATGEVKGRASTRGKTLQALVSQTEEVVLTLLGRGDEVSLDGSKAMERLGFESKEDLAAFKKHRLQHPELTTGEALTSFIIAHNSESNALATAETTAFALAALAAAAMIANSLVGVLLLYNVRVPPAAIPFGLCNILLCPAACGLGLTGLILSIVDAFNIGRVEVQSKGCCRNDADIQDAENRTRFTRTAALLAALLGPLPAVLGFFFLNLYVTAQAFIVAAGGSDTASLDSNYYVRPDYQIASYLTGSSLPCGLMCAVTSCFLTVPIAGFLLFWPSAPFVTDDDVEKPSRPAKGVSR